MHVRDKKIDNDLTRKIVMNKFFNKFNINVNTILIVVFFFIVMVILNTIWTHASKQYQILYDHLSHDDREKVISHLIHMNIPYRFNENSGMLLIPENQVYDTRLQLAEKNLPKSPSIGFELLDQEKFGTSQFNEQINYQRALEGELSRTIEKLKMITQARVHIALPKSSLFIREIKEPTASVILNLKPEQHLKSTQVNAILHLIASSVSGLKVKHITIVDQYGSLLNKKNNLDSELNESQFKYTTAIEKKYQKHIEDILIPILGLNNVHAQVTAQINFNNREQMAETFEPNVNTLHQSIRSYQSNNKTMFDEKNVDHSFSDVFNHKKTNFNEKLDNNVSNNKKNNVNKQDMSHILALSQKNHDNTVNYELDHTISHKKIKIGGIKRLSAAVVINFIQNNQGNLFPLNKKQMYEIKALVCDAIGYSKIRGDSVHVINFLFVKDIGRKIFPTTKIEKKIIHDIDKNKILYSNFLTKIFWLNFFKNFNIKMSLFFVMFILLVFHLYHLLTLKNILKKQNISYMNNKITKTEKQDNKYKIDNEQDVKNDKEFYNNINKKTSSDMAKIVRKWISDEKL